MEKKPIELTSILLMKLREQANTTALLCDISLGYASTIDALREEIKNLVKPSVEQPED